jgi:phosphatidylserine decarboxylase
VNRNPVKGKVKYATADKGSTSIAVENGSGTTVFYRQVGGLTKRVVSYVKEGDVVEQGTPFGFSMLGSHIDVFLPIGTKASVETGDIVKGGQTVLAQLKS